MHPLDHGVARINRAEQHLADLIRRTALREQAQADAMNINAHPTESDKIIVGPRQMPLDPMFSILVGEVCYNLRAALDYLVFALARLDSGAEQKLTQFPIADNASEFNNQKSRLKGLTSTHVKAIEALQPYNPGCEWIGRLRDWSNPDKHRTLVPVQIEHEVTVHVVDQDHLHNFEDMPGPTRPVVTRNGTEAFVKFKLGTNLQFADGSPVMQPLAEIWTKVADTLGQFRSDFT